MPARPFICFVGIAPTTGDTAIGQSILQQLKAHLPLPIRVHTGRTDVFGALPEIVDADAVRGRLPSLPLPAMRSPAFPFRLQRLVRDLRATGGAATLPPATGAALREALEGCAAIIFQGGPAWNDRMMNPRKTLQRWLFLEAARHYGALVYHVGVSCGPFDWVYPERLWMARFSRRALDLHDVLFVRDAFSRPALMRLGVSTRIVESTDAAVFLQARRDPAFDAVEDRIGFGRGRPKLVVCVRDYQPAYPEARAARESIFRSLASVLDHVQRELADVYFLSTDHNRSPEKQTDVVVAWRVQQLMTVPGSVALGENVHIPSALKHIYGRFDAMLSMRLHPAILALDAGVPCLLLAYDRKCRDFFSSLELDDYAVPLERFRPADVVQALEHMLRDAALRSRIRSAYRALEAAHAHDYAPMYEAIAARARDIARRSACRTAAVAHRLEGEMHHG